MWKFPKYEILDIILHFQLSMKKQTWEYGLDSDFKRVKFDICS